MVTRPSAPCGPRQREGPHVPVNVRACVVRAQRPVGRDARRGPRAPPPTRAPVVGRPEASRPTAGCCWRGCEACFGACCRCADEDPGCRDDGAAADPCPEPARRLPPCADRPCADRPCADRPCADRPWPLPPCPEFFGAPDRAGAATATGFTVGARSPTRPATAAPSGVTLSSAAVIFAARSRADTSRRCASKATVTTRPRAPARAVRPERCRYALCSVGGSTWTTSSTSSTWMPRAATSVATSTPHARPARERGEVAVAGVLRQVAVQVDGGDARGGQLLGELLGRCLVRVNRMRRPGPEARSLDELVLRIGSRDVEHVVGHDAPTGSRLVDRVQDRFGRKRRDERVDAVVQRRAEQQALSALRGRAARMRVTPGRKPRSAMWSASSSTVISTSSRRTMPCFIRSSRRPGQATTMSTPARSAATCGRWLTPPKTVVTLRPQRLGQRLDGRGDLGRELAGRREDEAARAARAARPPAAPARRATSGRAKAMVLPRCRCCRGRARRARRGRRAACRAGSGRVRSCRRRRGRRPARAGTPRSRKEGISAF